MLRSSSLQKKTCRWMKTTFPLKLSQPSCSGGLLRILRVKFRKISNFQKKSCIPNSQIGFQSWLFDLRQVRWKNFLEKLDLSKLSSRSFSARTELHSRRSKLIYAFLVRRSDWFSVKKIELVFRLDRFRLKGHVWSLLTWLHLSSFSLHVNTMLTVC